MFQTLMGKDGGKDRGCTNACGGKEKKAFGEWGTAGVEETGGVEWDINQENKLGLDHSREDESLEA